MPADPIRKVVKCVFVVLCLMFGGVVLAEGNLRIVGQIKIRIDDGTLSPLSGVLISQLLPKPPKNKHWPPKVDADSKEVVVALTKEGFSEELVVIREGDVLVIDRSKDILNHCFLGNVDRSAPIPATGGGPGPHGFRFNGMISWPSLYSVTSNHSTPTKAIPANTLWVYVQGASNIAAVSSKDGLFEVTHLDYEEYSFRLWKPNVGRLTVEDTEGLELVASMTEQSVSPEGTLDLGTVIVKHKPKPTTKQNKQLLQ